MPFVTLLFSGIKRQIACGSDTCKSTSPSVGDLFVATGANKLYVCFVPGRWSAPFILSEPESGQHQIKSMVQLADGKWKVVYGTSES